MAEACNESFDPPAAWAALEALVRQLEFPATDVATLAADTADGTQIRRAAWLVEFIEYYNQEYPQQ
jgi:hypothetical protein